MRRLTPPPVGKREACQICDWKPDNPLQALAWDSRDVWCCAGCMWLEGVFELGVEPPTVTKQTEAAAEFEFL